MNKTLKLALGAVLTAAMVAPALAQDQFPDVPDNHWAYEALSTLKKDGLLVGYPDGLFRGNRPASRYELAVAVHAAYMKLRQITDGLQSQIDDLKGKMGNGPDLTDIKNQIAALQDEVNNMKGWGADIDNLKKLADQFQKELASLGVDVEGLKKDLADLAKRVGVLEAHRLPVDIHGDVNLFMNIGMSDSHRAGVDVMGRPVGVRQITVGPGAGSFAPAGFGEDMNIYHELDLRIQSNNESGPRWHGDLAVGNLLGGDFLTGAGGAFPSQSSTASGQPYGTPAESVYFQDLAVDFDTSVIGQGLSAELGRTGYMIDPYIFKRPDVTPYFQNDRWDDGKWYFDGGILGFHWGGVKLDVFGGRQDTATDTTSFGSLQGMTVGAVGHAFTPGGARPTGLYSNGGTGSNGAGTYENGINVDEHLGLNLGVPLGSNGKLDLAYIWFESNAGIDAAGGIPDRNYTGGVDNDPRVANRAQVFGGSLKYNFGQVVLEGGYSQSNLLNGNANVVNRDNYAWHAGLAYDASRWGIQAGYRDIQPQFGAPGDWGRIGMWWNPTDIKGPEASIHLNITDQLKLTAGGEWYNGTGENITMPASFGGAVSTGMSTSDRLDHYTAELGFRLNEAWNVTLGAELVNWNLKEAGFPGHQPTERWYNIGLGYNLSDMARLSFLWQISDYDGHGAPGFAPFAGANTDRATGNLLTTQLSVKF